MNISYNWLRTLVPGVTDSPRELADRLAMLGAPVDELVELGAELGAIQVARVMAVRAHPNADRLRLCTVDAGAGAPLQVVCGAPNVTADQLYPFAPIGARLPGGTQIRKAKIRGEVSEGMLCSARELELGRDAAGLMTLHGDWVPGELLVHALGLPDTRLVVDVTPNRPDLLSHLGIAREVAPDGLTGICLPELPGAMDAPPEQHEQESEGQAGGVNLRIDAPELCPRYMAATIRGVRVAPSPEWLATRLRVIGLRPINNVVDATNYVLHELGQPLHAFDLDRLAGGAVRVRRAEDGELLRTLDGVERRLDAGTLIIADAIHPTAVAGVMGGEASEVSDDTTNVLLECALFDRRAVREVRGRLGLSTEASYRFERGVDPEGLPRAIQRAVQLIVAVAGGRLDGEVLDLRPGPRHSAAVIPLRPERVEQVLGVALTVAEITDLLEPLGFRVEVGEMPRVTVPSYRVDVEREIDLIEEIARRHGYNEFPERLLPFRPGNVPPHSELHTREMLHDLFARWGFLEARTSSFAPAAANRLPLRNPLSQEDSHLREMLLPGLLRRVRHNWAQGVRDVRFYEIGTVFIPPQDGESPSEEVHVAAAFTGARRPPHWSGGAAAWDVWDLKGLLEEIAALLGMGRVETGDWAELSPLTVAGQGLWLERDGIAIGGGSLATPQPLDPPPWADSVWILEARLLPANAPPARRVFRSLPAYPAVERDLALVAPFAVTAASMHAVVQEAAGALLEQVEPFDVYLGEGIPAGARSVSWRLRFRSPERTLTDAEADKSLARVVAALEERLDVRRR